MATVQQNYVERDKIPESIRASQNTKIRMKDGKELEVCKGLESEDKCSLYLKGKSSNEYATEDVGEGDRIMIYESGRYSQGRLGYHSEEKVIQPYKFIRHAERANGNKGTDNDIVGYPSNGYQAIVDKAKIFRTPIFSRLVKVPAKFQNSNSSIYLSGITNNMNDNNAIKEQISVNNGSSNNYLNVLKSAQESQPNSIYLYAKAKNTQNFNKVSFDEGDKVTLYPIGSTYDDLYDAEDVNLTEENAADTEIATMLQNAEQHKIDINKVCAKLSYGQMMGKSSDFLTKYNNENKKDARETKLKARIAKITKAMNYQQLISNYVLIISTEEWTLIEEAGNERKPNSFFPFSFNSKGGRRKTNKNKKKYISTYKKRNKKSCKGKSKKQNKSRKVFFY